MSGGRVGPKGPTVLAFVLLACLATGPTAGQSPAGDRLDVVEASIDELQAALGEGRTTSRHLVEAYLARIEAYDQAGPALKAMVSLNPRAREEAEALDRERAASGPRGPLHGIPLVVKDNFNAAGMPTTAGALGLATLRPTVDAFQVARLRAAGAIILGKTAMHELASGITNVSSLTGQTRNPYDLARQPGGSSGGTAVAVAASFAAAGLGTDTCGSIRIPAAHNALVGLRATRGLSSRSGVVPLSLTQDVAGPLARSVGDLAILLDATAGLDEADPVTREGLGRIPRSYREAMRPDGLAGARLGIVPSLFGDAPDEQDVSRVVRSALDAMTSMDAEAIDVQVPGLDDLLRDSSVINDEFKFDLAEYLATVPDAPIKSLADILDRGLHHAALDRRFRERDAVEARGSDHYRRALAKHAALRAVLVGVLDEHRLDALAFPTIRRTAAIIGEPEGRSNCQVSASSGLPALSMPVGFTDDGLPVGLELLGREFAEGDLLRLAFAFERARRVRQPPFSTPPLVDGAAPPPVTFDVVGREARVEFTYEPTTSRLRYRAAATGRGDGSLIAVTLQRGTAERPGPVVFHLIDAGRNAGTGELTVRAPERDALANGELYVHTYTEHHPLGAERVRVTLPTSSLRSGPAWPARAPRRR